MSTIADFADADQNHPPPPTTRAPPIRRRRRTRRASRRGSHAFTSEPTTTDGGSSFGLSDSDRLDSSFACDECGSSGLFSYNHSCIESSDDEIDLESGKLELELELGLGLELKLRCNSNSSGKIEKLCRICHLNFEIGCGDHEIEDGGDDGGGGGGDGGGAIELGCNCKGDLGTSHKQCAETWFKIKGNMICEICGAAAQNVGGDQAHEVSQAATETEPVDRSASTGPVMVPTEPRTFWQGRRIMNILLGCMVFAFIISWLFHFNVLP